MICRLCLTNLNIKQAVQLFETPTNETKLIKMIAKFFYLEISHDDHISTKICQKCRDHLEDFYEFWTYVDTKQSTLKEETHIAVKHDVEAEPCLEAGDIVKGDDCAQQDELPLDIKSIQMPLEVCFKESGVKTAEVDYSSLDNNVMHDALDITTDNYYSTDDDLPLLQLKTKVDRKKRKVVAAPNSQQTSERITKLQRNIEIIDKAMDLSCDLCKAPVEGYAQLRSHFSEKHDCPPYVMCCGKSIQKPSKLIQHINWHNSLFKCEICGKELRSENSLIMHKESFHSIKTDKMEQLSCCKCNKGFSSKKRLENHIFICNNEHVFACSICKKSYSSEKRLQRHTARHENEKEELFTCKSCGKTFPTATRMQKHFEAIHEKVYYHVCDVCGKQFRFKPSFKKHVLEHQGIVEPTAQCNLCGDWLKNSQALRLHKFKHDTVNVKCHHCGRICNSRTALIRHINYTHKLNKNLPCKFCDKTFKQSRNLDEHMAIHTGAQLYSCPHCTKECRSRSNMYVHIKRNHVKEWLESKAARSNDPNLNTKLRNQNPAELNVTFF